MQQYFISRGRRLVSDAHLGRVGTRQVFVGVDWTRDPGEALLLDKGNAEEIAQKFGGKEHPHREIVKFR